MMISAMILAHLVADYVFQTDAMARWKSQSLRGVFIHGSVVLVVTVLFALAIDIHWWPWALFIGLTHIAVDAAKLRLGAQFNAFGLFLLDQAAHISIIILALIWSGKLAAPTVYGLLSGLGSSPLLTFALGYVFLTVPSWVLIEFIASSCVKGLRPDFSQAGNKYVSSLERSLMMTFVLLGQFLLVPLVPVPRLLVEAPQALRGQRALVYVAQCLTSIALAVAIGLGLRRLW